MKSVDNRSVGRICLIAGTGLAAATVLGFFGRVCWVCDLFSHFRVQFFQLALILIGIPSWRRCRSWLRGKRDRCC